MYLNKILIIGDIYLFIIVYLFVRIYIVCGLVGKWIEGYNFVYLFVFVIFFIVCLKV